MMEKFERAGDAKSAKMLSIIYEDEKTHVFAGSKWFLRLCEDNGLEPANCFRDQLKAHFGGALKPPFNIAARDEAGLPRIFMSMPVKALLKNNLSLAKYLSFLRHKSLNLGMRLMDSLLEKLREAFAERQIYVRKNGSVTFVPLSSRSLVVLTMLFVLVAGWVGYASVHVIFNNGLGAKREQEVREMQLAYENELNRLRLSYDDLNAQLVLTRDWFSETTDNLENGIMI